MPLCHNDIVQPCFFVSDLHGRADRYDKLLDAIAAERPLAVFIGGDVMPHAFAHLPQLEDVDGDFITGFIAPRLRRLKAQLGEHYPRVFVILGNDDPGVAGGSCVQLEREGLWHYAHQRVFDLDGLRVFGYAYVPPTPFLLKDWERYDVSRYVPPGGVSPEEGYRSVAVPAQDIRYGTIAKDLDALIPPGDLRDTILLLHTPPAETHLDRAGVDGKRVDGVPLDLHVGSIAVRRFIESRQPRLTLHGHIHESARMTGHWRDHLGETIMFSAAHDGPELALVRFDLDHLESASRELL